MRGQSSNAGAQFTPLILPPLYLCPLRAAWWRGVYPVLSTQFTFGPLQILLRKDRIVTQSTAASKQTQPCPLEILKPWVWLDAVLMAISLPRPLEQVIRANIPCTQVWNTIQSCVDPNLKCHDYRMNVTSNKLTQSFGSLLVLFLRLKICKPVKLAVQRRRCFPSSHCKVFRLSQRLSQINKYIYIYMFTVYIYSI